MSERLAAATKPIVLVVDDVAANRELLEAYLSDLGYDVRQARDGVEALETIEAEEPDLVLLDIDMPRMNGITLCAKLKVHPARRLIPVVLITAAKDRDTRLKGISVGADDFLTKPFDAKELLVRTKVLLRDRALNKRLDATESVLLAFGRAVEARDRYTIHHAERVGLYSREIGRALGRGEDDLAILYKGGVLHDLGKIGVPDAILLKPSSLTEEEFALMQTHSAKGEGILLPLRSTAEFLPIVRHHHERVDGRGYPDHLAGADIPIGARIAAIGDGWDAMTSDRPYRAGLDREEAMRRLRAGAGSQWDAELVDGFVALLERGIPDRIAASQLETPIDELARS